MAANHVQVRLSAEDAGVVRAWQEAKRGVTEFSQELDRAGQKGKKAGTDIKQGFGNLGNELTSYAAGFLSVSAGIGAVTASWTEYIKVQQQAALAMRSTLDASAKLSQLASTPAELQKLHEKRDYLTGKFGIGTDRAVDAIFAARSAGLDDAGLEMLAKGSIIGDDAKQASEFMGSIKQIYGERVDPRQAYNVALKASADAGNLEMSDVTKGLPKLMSPGDVLGLSLEDISAIFMQTSARHGREETSTRNQRLLAKLSMNERFAGRGMEGLQEFVNLPESEWKDIIGEDTEPRAAARALKEKFDAIKTTSAQYKNVAAATGTAADALEKQLQIHFDPSTEAGRSNIAKHEAVAAEVRAGRAEQRQFGVPELTKEAVLAQERERVANSGTGIVGRGLSMFARNAAYYMGASPEQIRFESQSAENFSSLGGIQKNWRHFVNQMDEAGFGTPGKPSFPDVTAKNISASTPRSDVVDTKSIVDEIRGLRQDIKDSQGKPVKIETTGAGAAVGGPAAPGLNDRHNGGASGSW